ncbi:hypothetical protein XocBAI15_04715 [Xanthomonas oryzae pv. oryzicola]|nr:hypothetical protein XocBAI15_04715 [Xanthomonas oryzae pv. oryzicola]
MLTAPVWARAESATGAAHFAAPLAVLGPDEFPTFTAGGQWKRGRHWSNGFVVGIAAIRAARKQDVSAAERLSELLEALSPFLDGSRFQDIGYVFEFSAGAAWDCGVLDPSVARRFVAAAAAQLERSLDSDGFLVCEWMEGRTAGVDQFANLGLWWRTAMSVNARYAPLAERAFDAGASLLLRPDGSCSEYARLEANGVVSRFSKNAGPEATWARGRAWAFYGTAIAHLASPSPAKAALLESMSERIAADFDAYGFARVVPPDEHEARIDSSAGAVIAAACLRLDGAGGADARRYAQLGVRLFDALVERGHVREPLDPRCGILRDVSAPLSSIPVPDESAVWGDYFMLECAAIADAVLPARIDKRGAGGPVVKHRREVHE